MITPKNLARLMDAYGQTHPEAHLQVTEIPQLPGTLRRSRPLRGSAETFVKTKRYLATLLVIQPEVLLADWAAYEAKGRWTPGVDAHTIQLVDPPALPGATLFGHGWDGENARPDAKFYSTGSSPANASDPIGFRAK